MEKIIFPILFTSFAFAAWPVIGNYSGVHGGWVGLIVAFGTVVAFGLISWIRGDISFDTMPGQKAITILMIAGVANGIGFYLYSMLVTSKDVPTAVFVVTVAVLMMVFAPLLAWMFNGDTLTQKQFLGLGISAIAVYLMVN